MIVVYIYGWFYKLLIYISLLGVLYFGRFLFYFGIFFIFTQLQHKGCAIVKTNNIHEINSKIAAKVAVKRAQCELVHRLHSE